MQFCYNKNWNKVQKKEFVRFSMRWQISQSSSIYRVKFLYYSIPQNIVRNTCKVGVSALENSGTLNLSSSSSNIILSLFFFNLFSVLTYRSQQSDHVGYCQVRSNLIRSNSLRTQHSILVTCLACVWLFGTRVYLQNYKQCCQMENGEILIIEVVSRITGFQRITEKKDSNHGSRISITF